MPSSFSNTDLEYMFWAGIRNGSIGTIGTKGDPGGITMSPIDTAHLDTLVTPGAYKQGNGALATTANGYPITNNSPGVMLVLAALPNSIVQEFQFTVGTIATRIFWKRQSSNTGATWTAWRAFTGTRMDQTAGRVLYEWDELNSREQLIYGDTGLRELTLINGWTVGTPAITPRIRRIGSVVYLNGYFVRGTDTRFVDIPLGFRAANFQAFPVIYDYSATPNKSVLMDTNSAGVCNIYGATTTETLYVSTSWTTLDAWPASLPGSAIGTIPNL